MPEPPVRSRICRLIDGEPPRWLLLLLVCLMLFVRGRVVASLDTNGLWSDPDGYSAVAENLVEHGTFAQHRDWHRRAIATAARPPLYPLILAALSWIADESTLFSVLHVVLGTATVIGVWHLGRLWSVPPGACLVAAGLVAIDPILLVHSAKVMTETLATFLATVGLIAFTSAASRASLWWAVAAGATSALAVLSRPEFFVWAVFVAAMFPFAALGPRRLQRAAVCVVAVAAVLAPWAIRNQQVFGRPVFLTTHGGFTLLLANNPSFYEYLRSGSAERGWDGEDVYREYRTLKDEREHVIPGIPGRTQVHVWVDEVSLDRAAYERAFENIRDEPAMFLWSCVVRVGRLWNVLPHQTSADESPSRRGMRYAVAIWYAFELALAAIGAWFLRRKLLVHPWLWGLLLVLSITLVHAFYWTDMRMRAPLMGVVALAAAVGLTTLACGRRGASASNASA